MAPRGEMNEQARRHESYKHFRCVFCKGMLDVSEGNLICRVCGKAYPIDPESGVPVFSESPYGIDDVQAVTHESGNYLTRFDSYNCRNGYLDGIFSQTGRLLDLAGGDGVITFHFQMKGFEAILIDVSLEALRSAYANGIRFAGKCDIEQGLPFSDNYFDYIFWGDNAEHLLQPARVLAEINRILKPGGWVVTSFPNMGYWLYRIIYLVKGKVPRTEVHKHKHWEFDHIRFYNQAIFTNFLKEGGLDPVAFKPIIKPRRPKIDSILSRYYPALFGEDLLAVARKPEVI